MDEICTPVVTQIILSEVMPTIPPYVDNCQVILLTDDDVVFVLAGP